MFFFTGNVLTHFEEKGVCYKYKFLDGAAIYTEKWIAPSMKWSET